MGVLRTPALWLSGSLALGIWAAHAFRPALPAALLLLVTTLLLLALALKAGRNFPPYAFLGLACLAFLSFGFFRLAGELPENRPHHYLHTAPGSHHFEIRLTQRLRPTAYSERWLGEVARLDGRPSEGTILLSRADTLGGTPWLPDHLVEVVAALRRPGPPPNPHQFDYAAYLESLGVYGTLRLEPGRYRHRAMPARTWQAHVGRLRQHLLLKLDGAGFSPAETGLLQALLLGSRDSLEAGQLADYQRAGAAHLLAVSGLHVGVFSTLITWLLWPLRRFRRGKALRTVLVLLALWAYVLLAGAGPAVFRAAVLFSLLAYAVLSGRTGQSLHFWALAILLLLGILEPRWLLQVGFQLSFAAVWAILAFYPSLYNAWPFKGRVGRQVGQVCGVGTAAQIGVLPISLFHFHQFPLHFLLANLLLLPMLGLVLGGGFTLLVLAAAGTLPAWLADPYGRVLRTMNNLAGWLGGQDAFLLENVPWGRVELCLGLGAVLALAGWVNTRQQAWLRAGLGCLLAIQGWGLWRQASDRGRVEWLVPHQVAAGGFWLREGPRLRVFSPEPDAFSGLARAYATGERIAEVTEEALCNSYRLGQMRLLVVDSDGVYGLPGDQGGRVLLSGSPPIHLGRLIEKLRPALIVADGSNYASFVRRWEKTCRAYGVPFHATALSGAYRFEIEPAD